MPPCTDRRSNRATDRFLGCTASGEFDGTSSFRRDGCSRVRAFTCWPSSWAERSSCGAASGTFWRGASRSRRSSGARTCRILLRRVVVSAVPASGISHRFHRRRRWCGLGVRMVRTDGPRSGHLDLRRRGRGPWRSVRDRQADRWTWGGRAACNRSRVVCCPVAPREGGAGVGPAQRKHPILLRSNDAALRPAGCGMARSDSGDIGRARLSPVCRPRRLGRADLCPAVSRSVIPRADRCRADRGTRQAHEREGLRPSTIVSGSAGRRSTDPPYPCRNLPRTPIAVTFPGLGRNRPAWLHSTAPSGRIILAVRWTIILTRHSF